MLDALLDKEEAKNSLKRIVVVGIFVVLKRVANLAQTETQLRMGTCSKHTYVTFITSISSCHYQDSHAYILDLTFH